MVWPMLDFDCSSLYFVVCAASDISRSISLRTRMYCNNFMFQNSITFLHKTFSFENKLFLLRLLLPNWIPYPATAYIKGFWIQRNWICSSGFRLKWFWNIFERRIENLFKVASLKFTIEISDNSKRIYAFTDEYKNNQSVIAFCKGKINLSAPNLSEDFCQRLLDLHN
jgi:hypothetical protein